MLRLSPLFLLAACWTPMVQDNEGSVCVSAPAADAEAEVTVHAQLCLSSSCSELQEAACEATVDGTTITVSSHFEWLENTSPMRACTDDCMSPSATCALGPLPAGTYTVLHGQDEVTLEVPGELACDPF